MEANQQSLVRISHSFYRPGTLGCSESPLISGNPAPGGKSLWY
jgi:hypothetical protein